MNPWYYPTIGEYATVLDNVGLETRHAMLFDRPVRLEEGANGLRNWIEMFGGVFLGALKPPRKTDFLRRVEERARPALFQDGAWTVDYRRLRVMAVKVPDRTDI